MRLSGATLKAAAAPDCVTVIVLVMPPPVIDTTALRWLVDGLAAATMVAVPSFMPLTGVTESQAASVLTLQLILAWTATAERAESAAKTMLVSATLRRAAAADWLIATLLLIPPPVIVTVALRELVVGLAVTITVTVVSRLPPAGESVTQGALSSALHATLAVTASGALAAPAAKERPAGLTERFAAEPAWVTVSMRTTPPPVKVTVAVRALVAGLARAVTVTVVSFGAAAGETISQAASSLALQLMLAVTSNSAVAASAPNGIADRESAIAAAPADWVTATFLVIPPPAMTTNALRGFTVGLAVTATVIIESPVPLAGETVSHAASALALQLMLELTVKPALPELAEKMRLVVDAVKMAAAADWVTVTLRVMPPPVMDNVPLRGVVVVLAATVTVTVVSLAPLAGDAESQGASSLTLQLKFEVIPKVEEPAPAPNESETGATVSTAAAPDWLTVIVLATPPPLTFTVALREAVEGLARTVRVTVAL